MFTDQQQTSGQIRIFAAMLAGFLGGKNYFFDEATWSIILMSLSTAAMAVWSAVALSRKGQKASVAAMPNVMVVTTREGGSEAHAADEVAQLPNVVQIVAGAEVARKTTSTKVVAAPTV